MPAVCSGCYRRPCEMDYHHLLAMQMYDKISCMQEKFWVATLQADFYGKHVPVSAFFVNAYFFSLSKASCKMSAFGCMSR